MKSPKKQTVEKAISRNNSPALKTKKKGSAFFETFSARITHATGSTTAFFLASGCVLAWLFSGPFFDYSETWQLVINTGTTIVTFLMVFLIQKTQNKDSLALQLKLNELVASQEFASNRLVDVESLTEEELRTLQEYYKKLRDLALAEHNLLASHSIDEAKKLHNYKMKSKTHAQVKKAAADKS